ncbi:uncharacterized protein ACRADG_005126 [Cochliomyia hominivorax]
MNETLFRHEFVKHFMGRVKDPKLQQKTQQSYLNEQLVGQHSKEYTKAHQNVQELEANLNAKQRSFNLAQTSGGDADRMLYYPNGVASHYGSDSYRQRNGDNEFSIKQLPTNPKPSAPVLTTNSSRKYQTTSVNNCIGDHRYLYENDSNLCGLGNGSEDSAKSQKSSKTVVSRKSSQELRKMVTSQCKLHEVIDETLKQMGNADIDNTVDNNTACGLLEQPSVSQYPLTMNQCKRCTERIHSVLPQKDVTTEIGKGDFDSGNNERLTISVDDVVNSKVIFPMVRKLQRMYMNNLKEEMSLMEDLERLPYKVNELYKATIFKQKD